MNWNILIIGGGGREHAIAKKMIASKLVANVYCAPGNQGMKRDGIQPVEIAEDDHKALIAFANDKGIRFTFVGPEVPLLAGIVDDFETAGLKIFGPRKAAALIEGSKDFAKEIMIKYGIPTAAYETFSNYEEAQAYVDRKGTPIVIKADGLAAGKGVVVAEDQQEATLALKDMLQDNKFGASGAKVVIEDFLTGEEFSLLSFVNGTQVYPMVIAQDHKCAYEGDRGPNTGGMGAYSPVPQIPQKMIDEAVKKIVIPAAKGLVAEGRHFRGILYAGLIATEEGPKVIEFNARFGDPETQVVLPRLKSDLVEIIDALLNDKEPSIEWQEAGYNLGVVVAADGYPGSYKKGAALPDFSELKDTSVYFAGVAEASGKLVAAGGRVYLIEAAGATLKEAQQKVYKELDALDTKGTFYRSDIGFKAID